MFVIIDPTCSLSMAVRKPFSLICALSIKPGLLSIQMMWNRVPSSLRVHYSREKLFFLVCWTFLEHEWGRYRKLTKVVFIWIPNFGNDFHSRNADNLLGRTYKPLLFV